MPNRPAAWLGKRSQSTRLSALLGAFALAAVFAVAGCASTGTGTATAAGAQITSSSPTDSTPTPDDITLDSPSAATAATSAPATSAPPTTAAPASVPAAPAAPKTQAPPPAPAPAPTTAAAKPSLCGAPSNPFGYNFCGRGGYIYSPDSTVCSYFDCIANFGNGTGYMVECLDGTYSMSGGRRGACSYHGGVSRPVYSG